MNQTVEELITELSMTYSFMMHLIVEGDDDRRFYRSCMSGFDKVNLICGWGADNVVDIIREVDKARVSARILPTLGLIDRDYRIPLGTLWKSQNLIASDARDIECMMFGSPSFETVLAEFGSKNKVACLGGSAQIASMVIASASTVGQIRYHNQQLRNKTTFQKLELSKVVDRRTLAIDPSELIRHLNARQGSSGCALPQDFHERAIDACIKAGCENNQPYFQHELLLCRGHDLMELLAIGFRSLFGSRSAAESSGENVEALFRLNYVAHFRATPMARSIEAWLASNSIAPHVAVV